MKDSEQVFGSYTLKQVSMIESEYFVVRFDGDFYNDQGYYLFTMSQANNIYRNLINDLCGVVHQGEKKDKELALDLILGMVVESVRYH